MAVLLLPLLPYTIAYHFLCNQGFNVTEESKEHFEEKTLEMVADLLRKLNSDNHQLEIADSKALRRLQEEAIKINNVIESFMAYSSKVLNEEGESMKV